MKIWKIVRYERKRWVPNKVKKSPPILNPIKCASQLSLLNDQLAEETYKPTTAQLRQPSLQLEARYYTIALTQDLWGSWIITYTHGGLGTRLGRVRHEVFNDVAACLKQFYQACQRREKTRHYKKVNEKASSAFPQTH